MISLDLKDKFSKARKIYDLMNKNFQQFGIFHTHYSIDDQMVSYINKYSNKQ